MAIAEAMGLVEEARAMAAVGRAREAVAEDGFAKLCYSNHGSYFR